MKAIWIVRWRGLEEEYRCPQDAMDRLEQLEARGIETEVFEQRAGERRPVHW
jgi:hypothetical protein